MKIETVNADSKCRPQRYAIQDAFARRGFESERRMHHVRRSILKKLTRLLGREQIPSP